MQYEEQATSAPKGELVRSGLWKGSEKPPPQEGTGLVAQTCGGSCFQVWHTGQAGVL